MEKIIKTNTNFPTLLIIGSGGLVGSKVKQILNKRKINLLYPSSFQFNILNTKSVLAFLKKTKPLVVLNCAAFTNVEEAEKQRGDKKGLAWKTNVEGAKNIALACKKLNIFLIHISTDAVFFDFKNNKGGYDENLKPIPNLQKLPWYGYTKLQGEQQILKSKVKCAIIRISYPFGNSKSKKDYILKTVQYIKSKVSFFEDFYFTPTFIPDLAIVIEKIAKLKKTGVFHVSCTNIATPYQIALYTAKKLKLKNALRSQNLHDYLNNKNTPYRPQYSNLKTSSTQQLLKIRFHNWQSAIDKFIYEIN